MPVPSFSSSLEQALFQALALANERHHEYSALEHLLLALLEDHDAAEVLRACGADLPKLRKDLIDYIENELDNLVTDDEDDSKPTAGFQRVIQRAVIHVQSSGRTEVTGANVLVAIFAERESHAAYFLQEQDITRYDAINYIANGIAKRMSSSTETVLDDNDIIDTAKSTIIEENKTTEKKPTRTTKASSLLHSLEVAMDREALKPFIFISYSRADQSRAKDIRSMLIAEGFSVWWDQDIDPGEQWREQISSRLDRATVVLTVWTAKSVESAAVREEAARAQTGRRLVHMRLDSCELPYGFSETQYVDMRDWDGTKTHPTAVRLVEALRIKLDPPSYSAMTHRLSQSSPVSAVVRDGKLTQIDRPEYVPPPIQDVAELQRRLNALCELSSICWRWPLIVISFKLAPVQNTRWQQFILPPQRRHLFGICLRTVRSYCKRAWKTPRRRQLGMEQFLKEASKCCAA
jgi:hypothetical protein